MKRSLNLIIVVLALVMLAIPSVAVANVGTDLEGTWAGVLEMPGAELEMVFHITDEGGIWVGTLDVPAQGALGIPISEVRVQEGVVVFDVTLIAGVYSGSVGSDENSLEGVWEQSGMKIPLTLERSLTEFTGPNRPQGPKPPYPYSEVEVRYPNPEAGIELAGTLT